VATEATERPEWDDDSIRQYRRWLVCPYGCGEYAVEFDLRDLSRRQMVCANGHPAVHMRMLFRDRLIRLWFP
jgi:hypothetical protein